MRLAVRLMSAVAGPMGACSRSAALRAYCMSFTLSSYGVAGCASEAAASGAAFAAGLPVAKACRQ